MTESGQLAQSEVDLAWLRASLYDHGARRRSTDDTMMRWVLERVGGDSGLAFDAITQVPRPEWLRELIGSALRSPRVGA